jgi:xanthine/CO dehydrogenase XdhC/CoxF family maturation factor
LSDLDPVFKSKINGPVGLDIGADSAESIALALLAEIHQKLKKTTKG